MKKQFSSDSRSSRSEHEGNERELGANILREREVVRKRDPIYQNMNLKRLTVEISRIVSTILNNLSP